MIQTNKLFSKHTRSSFLSMSDAEIISPQLPPPPLAKPGRIKVYMVVSDVVPKEANELRLCEGDIVYLAEAKEDEKYHEGKCIERSEVGRVRKECVGEQLELIKFPLHEAAKMGDFDFVRECLDNRVSVNGLDSSGSTALHWAAYAGHAPIVQHLLSVPNVNMQALNKLGDSPLHGASAKGRVDCVRLLIEAGANVKLRNRERKTAAEVTLNPEIGALLRTTLAARGADAEYLEDEEGEENDDEISGREGSE